MITVKRKDLWRIYLAWWFASTLSRWRS